MDGLTKVPTAIRPIPTAQQRLEIKPRNQTTYGIVIGSACSSILGRTMRSPTGQQHQATPTQQPLSRSVPPLFLSNFQGRGTQHQNTCNQQWQLSGKNLNYFSHLFFLVYWQMIGESHMHVTACWLADQVQGSGSDQPRQPDAKTNSRASSLHGLQKHGRIA